MICLLILIACALLKFTNIFMKVKPTKLRGGQG